MIAAGGPALLFTRVRGAELPARHEPLRHRAARRAGLRPPPAAARPPPRRAGGDAPAADAGQALGRARRARREALRVGLARRASRARCTEVVDAPTCGSTGCPSSTCWPEDGGPFVTLPLVYTEHPDGRASNLGMYRMQVHDARTTGMHWQIGKGGGFHYAAAEARGEALPVTVFLGGPPALILAAIAPLPENVPELLLASLIAGRAARRAAPGRRAAPARRRRRVRARRPRAAAASAGPRARSATTTATTRCATTTRCSRSSASARRRDAIYPATVVGKPRQEDFFLGDYLQELLSPLFPLVMPGGRDLWSLRRDRLPLARRGGRARALQARGDGRAPSASSARASSR